MNFVNEKKEKNRVYYLHKKITRGKYWTVNSSFVISRDKLFSRNTGRIENMSRRWFEFVCRKNDIARYYSGIFHVDGGRSQGIKWPSGSVLL